MSLPVLCAHRLNVLWEAHVRATNALSWRGNLLHGLGDRHVGLKPSSR